MPLYRLNYNEPYFKNMGDRSGRYFTTISPEGVHSFEADNDDTAKKRAAEYLARKNQELPEHIRCHKIEFGEPLEKWPWDTFQYSPQRLWRVTVPAVAEQLEEVHLT